MITEFEVGDVKYSCRKMNVMTQAQIVKRLTPLFGALQVLLRGRKTGDTTPVSKEQAAEAVKVAVTAVATMSDEDTLYIYGACLSLCSRLDGTTWAPVWNAAGQRPMYDDIGLMQLYTITFNVLKASIGPFSFASQIG